MSYVDASAEIVEPAVSRSLTDSRLSGRWLVLARLLSLSLCGLSVGLLVASIPWYFAYLHLLCTGTAAACNARGQLAPSDVGRLQELGLSLDFFATYTVVLMSLLALGYWLVAALLLWRKSDNRLALFAAVCLSTFPITFNSGFINILSGSWWLLAHCISLLSSLCIVLFFYIFPTGHFVPRWTRFVLLPSFAYWGFNEFFPVAAFNPFFRFPLLDVVTFLSVVGGMVIVQVYRYRRVSTASQRQQTKWVVYGVSMGVGGFLVLSLLVAFFPSFFPNGSLVNLLTTAAIDGFILLLPLSIGLAVLRSKLWDIDSIINRTLVYSMLTGILALMYVGLVFALQVLLHGLVSQTSNSDIAIVVSTLVIAALFQPLRKRTQAVIDRRFYRRKYDAARTLAGFSATLRGEVDLEQLNERLVAVVQETMQPAHVSLWLRRLPQEVTYQAWNSNSVSSSDEE